MRPRLVVLEAKSSDWIAAVVTSALNVISTKKATSAI